MPAPLLRTEGIRKTYTEKSGQPHAVLNDISLSFECGSSLSLTGPSGSGKSTLLNIVGLLDRPTSGTLFYHDQPVSTWSVAQRESFRAEKMGFVFQRHLLLPEFSLLENVTLPLARVSGWNSRIRTAGMEMLEWMSIDHRAHAKPAHLSGGEMQRGAICRALIHHPQLLLLDEPTGNLDPELGHTIMTQLLERLKEQKVSCILVTHNPDFAALTEQHYTLQHHTLQQQ